jgi:Uma2 family endonuclease
LNAEGEIAMSRVTSRTTEPEWTWEIARLFPLQGGWTEEEYFALDGCQLVEFSDGYLEFPPMATTSHQLIVLFLYGLLLAFSSSRDAGRVLVAPLPVRLWRRKIREPDVVFMTKEHADRISERYWKGADLVMEVVSGDKEDRRRDLEVKRSEYARAGIREYWIVDPKEERITVLRLRGKRYVVHGEFDKGATATSPLLDGFTVDVSETFAQQLGRPAKKVTRKSKRPSKE